MIATIGSITIFGGAFALLAIDKIHRVKVVLFAAALMLAAGFVPAAQAFYSPDAGIDWDVIFLLLGMMVIVSIIQRTGLFEYLAIVAAQRSRGRPYLLMVLLMVLTALASPVLDNVTTVMLVAPVTIAVCRSLGISPVPYLIAEVLASNIGGASTLIGDPPNIIVASRAGFGFNDFLVHMAPIVIVLFGVFVLMTRVMFRREFRHNPERVAEVLALDARKQISDPAMLRRCLAVLGVVIVAFTAHSALDLAPSVIALLGAGLMVLATGVGPDDFVRDVEWETLVFFMALFVMVGGLVETGVIGHIGSWITELVGDNLFGAATMLLWGSAVFGAFFDNIPYTATMAPIVGDLAAQAPTVAEGDSLWWAFTLGADLGGNGTAIAASANVVVLSMAARAGHRISFWQFTKYGIVTTLVTTALAWLYVWARYFA